MNEQKRRSGQKGRERDPATQRDRARRADKRECLAQTVRENTLANTPAKVPVAVDQGDGDTAVAPAATAACRQACASGATIFLHALPGNRSHSSFSGHSRIFSDGSPIGSQGNLHRRSVPEPLDEGETVWGHVVSLTTIFIRSDQFCTDKTGRMTVDILSCT
jgi:hypothetical protein